MVIGTSEKFLKAAEHAALNDKVVVAPINSQAIADALCNGKVDELVDSLPDD